MQEKGTKFKDRVLFLLSRLQLILPLIISRTFKETSVAQVNSMKVSSSKQCSKESNRSTNLATNHLMTRIMKRSISRLTLKPLTRQGLKLEIQCTTQSPGPTSSVQYTVPLIVYLQWRKWVPVFQEEISKTNNFRIVSTQEVSLNSKNLITKLFIRVNLNLQASLPT